MDKPTAEQEESLEILAPILPKRMVNELCSGRCWSDYRERKMQVMRGQVAFGIFAQKRIAQFTAGTKPRFVEGLGQWKACIDPDLYFRVRAKYGPDCWRDADFFKHTLKHTPEIRVPAPAQKFIPVNGFREERNGETANGRNGEPKKNSGAGNGVQREPATATPRLRVCPAHGTPRANAFVRGEK